MVPYAAPQYNCDGFAVTNVALKGTTQIRFTDKFALPVFAQAVWNPRMEDAHLVFGISLRRGNLKQATHGQRTERTTLFRFAEKIPAAEISRYTSA